MPKTTARSWLPGFILVGVIWGASFLLIKVALDNFTILGVAWGRQTLGAIALFIWLLIDRSPFVRDWSTWKHVLVVSLTLNALPGALYAWGETMISSSLAGIVNATTPLMTTLAILIIFRGERISYAQIAGLVLGFFGVVILSGQLFAPESINLSGVLILLGATACYGIGLPYTKKYLSSTSYSSTSLATAQVLGASILLAPVLFLDPVIAVPVSELTWQPVLSLIVLGAVGTGFAYIINLRTITLAGSAIASTVTYFSPVVAIVAGWAVLGEELHWYVLLGGAFIIVSALLVQQRLRLPRWLERQAGPS